MIKKCRRGREPSGQYQLNTFLKFDFEVSNKNPAPQLSYLISQCVTLFVSPGSTATTCSITIGSGGCWKRGFSLKGMSLNFMVGQSNILCRYSSHLIVSRCIGSCNLFVWGRWESEKIRFSEDHIELCKIKNM